MTTIKIHFSPPRGSDGRVDARGHGINWLGATRTEWKIYDLHGHYALHVRADFPSDGKAFLWEHPDRRHSRNREISSTDRLYGLELVNGQRRGLLVEGEKCADAARAVLPSWLVCATVGGAFSTPDADVLDRLAHVPSWTLWGDADANGAGQEHMRQIAKYLKRRGCRVRTVAWHAAPPGGDVADYLKSHSRGELLGLLKAAK